MAAATSLPVSLIEDAEFDVRQYILDEMPAETNFVVLTFVAVTYEQPE